MTTANIITVIRILLVPYFVVQLLYYFAGGDEWDRFEAVLAFAVAALADGVDGYIARRYNQRSELGAILDPLADKLLLLSGIVLLSIYDQKLMPKIPTWLTATVVSRDVILLLGIGVLYYVSGKIKVVPHFIGKVATLLQMVTVAWALLKWNEHVLVLWATGAAVTTGISGLLYVRDGIRRLGQSPSSQPEHLA
jgi:cardiolipin synthase (CMP-forming)